MTVELANSNAVVVAKQFNPSITNQLWLVENNLVARDGFRPGCLFSDMLANIVTSDFTLFVSPPQVQFSPLGDATDHQRLAEGVLGRLVAILPHTPYTAAGLNFTWHFRPPEGSGAFSRALFHSDRPQFREFDTEDARFGGYFSKNALGCRLKLDVKPAIATVNDEKIELMQFAFNYHLDVDRNNDAVIAIQRLLSRWDEARGIASQIMETVQG